MTSSIIRIFLKKELFVIMPFLIMINVCKLSYMKTTQKNILELSGNYSELYLEF